jgi:hypothetical protein
MFIASFSVYCRLFDLVTLYVNDVIQEEYPMVNASSIDSE